MKWVSVAIRFPKWAVAILIVVLSSVLFTGWLLFRGTSPSASAPGEAARVVNPAPAPASLEFDPNQVILCGNTLLRRDSGEIIAAEWLEGLGAGTPSIGKVIAAEKLVILKGDNGAVGAFGFDGKAEPALTVDGKPFKSGAFDRDFKKVMFPREGDLWKGEVDWSSGKILSAERFTETGYFRDDLFRSAWLWHEDDLFVSTMGKTLQVRLHGGAVTEIPVSLHDMRRGMSPDGTFLVMTPGGFDVMTVDILTGETGKFSVKPPVRKLLWLSPRKALMLLGQDKIACYDHDLKAMAGPWSLPERVADILEASPGGNAFLAMGANKLLVVDSKAQRLATLTIKFEQVYWISDEVLLCSCNALDTDSRGIWLVAKTGKMEKLSGHALDSSRQGGGAPFVADEIAGFFVSGGNLWSLDLEKKTLRQLTQGQDLPPALQFLKP